MGDTVWYRFPGEKKNNERIQRIALGISFANKYFEHKDVQKYTWYRISREDRVDKTNTDMILV